MRSFTLGWSLLCLSTGTAWAAGVEMGEQGAQATGRAGAFTVKADDLSAISFNPAGLARLRGTRLYLNDRITISDIEFRRARTLDWSEALAGVPLMVDFPHVSNERPVFPLGLMAVVSSDFGWKSFTLAAGVFAPPGAGGASYPKNGPQKYMLTDWEINLLYYTLAAGWQVTDWFGVGASLQWVDIPRMQLTMVVDGNVTPLAVNPKESMFDFAVRIRGEDHALFNAILGAWLRIAPRWEIAAAAQLLPMSPHIKGHMSVEPMQMNLAEDDIALTKNGVPDDRVTFRFDLPMKVRGGVRYRYPAQGPELFDVELDVQYERWSVMDRFRLEANLTAELMGNRIDLGQIDITKHWRDTVAVRLGGDVRVIPERLWLRSGVFYETPAVRPAYAYLDFLSFQRVGLSAGATYRWHFLDLSASYTAVLQSILTLREDQARIYQQVPGSPCKPPYTDPQSCDEHYLGTPGVPVNAGTYRAYYHLFNLGIAATF
jgi:long-chain fatty acid transport protein